MKIRDMLEVAGAYQLKEFMWGDDVVEHVKKHIPECPISLETTGNDALSMIGEYLEKEYHNVLEDYLNLDVVNKGDKTEIILSWGKFSIKITLAAVAGVAGLGSLVSIYEYFKTGETPTMDAILTLVAAAAKFFL